MSPEILPPSDDYGFPSLDLDPDKLIALTESLMDQGVGYGMGYKAQPLSCQAPNFVGQNGQTGYTDALVDCSGFARWGLFHATGQGLLIPDGSAIQHEWIAEKGFKKSTISGGMLKDGAVRIAFLPPFGGEAGHVVLIIDGLTCESHGHHGPDRRPWTGEGWQAETEVFVLAPPKAGN